MEQYLDQRIINTKQDLYNALFDLLKSSTTIKVLDICKKANITPMTFYHHYGDKTQLLEDAIKDQLGLRLPIPKKLKPGNLKQLIYYLFHFLSEFSLNNKELIKASFINLDKGFKNSYLNLLIITIHTYIKNELSTLFCNVEPITINIWSDFITYGFMGLFFKRTIENKNIEFEVIKKNFNVFISNYIYQKDI